MAVFDLEGKFATAALPGMGGREGMKVATGLVILDLGRSEIVWSFEGQSKGHLKYRGRSTIPPSGLGAAGSSSRIYSPLAPFDCKGPGGPIRNVLEKSVGFVPFMARTNPGKVLGTLLEKGAAARGVGSGVEKCGTAEVSDIGRWVLNGCRGGIGGALSIPSDLGGGYGSHPADFRVNLG